MKRSWFAGVVAAGILLAGIAFLPDMGFAAESAGGHGGGGGHAAGGGGHGGGGGHAGGGGGHASVARSGGRGGGGHASAARSGRRGGGGHASAARSRGSSHRSVGRGRSSRTGKGVVASRRRATRNTQNGHTSRSGQGLKTKGAANNRNANRPGHRSINHLTANRSLRQASFSRHNAFFNNSRFGNANRGDFGRDNRWRDGSGNWYGYRWAGSVFWPYAFGDYFSYAIWPDGYSDSFWGYGPDALLWGTFWPYGQFTGDEGNGANESAGDIYNREPAAAARTRAAGGVTDLAQTCGGFAPGVSDLPI